MTQVDIEFVNLSSNKTFESPRIAAEFVLIASQSPKNAFNVSKRKTVDDEHTPGTFTLVDIVTPGENQGTSFAINLFQSNFIFQLFFQVLFSFLYRNIDMKYKIKLCTLHARLFIHLFANTSIHIAGSYLQYRPISYTAETRDITDKTDVQLNEPIFIEDAKTYLNSSLAYSYYGDALGNNLVQSFNISFGQTQDKFYSFTNYTTW